MRFEDMLSHVLPSVTGCPDQLAIDHLVKAARIFCAKTLVWNYSTLAIESVAGQALYPLQLDDGQELVRLLGCEVNGRLYETPGGLTGRRRQRAQESDTCVLINALEFQLEPAPGVAGDEIITDVAVKPTLTATEWPDELEESVSDIVHGAIASLCELPRVTWNDDKTALIQNARFADRINTVAFKVSKGFGRSRQGAAVQWF